MLYIRSIQKKKYEETSWTMIYIIRTKEQGRTPHLQVL